MIPAYDASQAVLALKMLAASARLSHFNVLAPPAASRRLRFKREVALGISNLVYLARQHQFFEHRSQTVFVELLHLRCCFNQCDYPLQLLCESVQSTGAWYT